MPRQSLTVAYSTVLTYIHVIRYRHFTWKLIILAFGECKYLIAFYCIANYKPLQIYWKSALQRFYRILLQKKGWNGLITQTDLINFVSKVFKRFLWKRFSNYRRHTLKIHIIIIKLNNKWCRNLENINRDRNRLCDVPNKQHPCS